MIPCSIGLASFQVCSEIVQKGRENYINYFEYDCCIRDIGAHIMPCLVALERTLEDHEIVSEAFSHWSKDHHNTVQFRNNPDKYLLFNEPQVQYM